MTQKSTVTSRSVSKWDFPVKPGTAEWKTLNSRDEKIKKCQIPSEILKSLTTQELVEICANYPLNMDAYAYTNISIGMAIVTASFNGYQELFKRNDNFLCIFEHLSSKEISSSDMKNMSSLEIGRAVLRYNIVESLFNYDEIIKNIPQNKSKLIISFMLKQVDFKMSQSKYIGLNSLNASIIPTCRILQHLELDSDSQISKIIQNGGVRNYTELQSLRNKCIDIINK